MTTQSKNLNLSDVTQINPKTLALVMRYLRDTGRGLAMLRGISAADLREVDRAPTPPSAWRRWCASVASSRHLLHLACASC